MKREIVYIDEELCDGCAQCIPNCHEGALQIIDGKARLISDLMCDGLGACIGHCPQGAITIEEREAEAYDEVKVMTEMVKKGRNTVIAHLRHLKEHNEKELVQAGVGYLLANADNIDFEVRNIREELHKEETASSCHSGGCPGSAEKTFSKQVVAPFSMGTNVESQLSHWPVQLHLVNPEAGFLKNSDVVIAADCSAFTYGNFHNDFIKGKSLVIACPKLDSGIDVYVDKIYRMIEFASINAITVVIMEVPCCGGLLQIVQQAVNKATRKVPVKMVVIGVQGDILQEKWV